MATRPHVYSDELSAHFKATFIFLICGSLYLDLQRYANANCSVNLPLSIFTETLSDSWWQLALAVKLRSPAAQNSILNDNNEQRNSTNKRHTANMPSAVTPLPLKCLFQSSCRHKLSFHLLLLWTVWTGSRAADDTTQRRHVISVIRPPRLLHKATTASHFNN